jgi:hypothetical protein
MLVCCGGDSEGKLRTIVSAFKALDYFHLKMSTMLSAVKRHNVCRIEVL